MTKLKCLAALVFMVSTARADNLQNDAAQEKFQKISPLSIDAQLAVSPDAQTAEAAIKSLREAGPDGLRVLAQSHDELLQRALKLSPQERAGHADWKRLKFALDQTGAQCDNWASKLYWFTDLEKAKAAAQKEHKPILSLRLLGNLNEELSCANSRFFRTALYPNASINAYLRENFILHWQSVRPAPKVTIDFGDGRKIQTTITGNSIHYLLDSEGRVLDALPGLYGPEPFFVWLENGVNLCKQSTRLQGAARDEYLKYQHEAALAEITRNWQRDVGRIKVQSERASGKVSTLSSTPTTQQIAQALLKPNANVDANSAAESDTIDIRIPDPPRALSALPAPTARRAAPLAVSKMPAEFLIMRAITVSVPRDRNALIRTTTDALWEKIAALHEPDATLDESSLQVLHAKALHPDQAAFAFQKSVAEDGVRNEYTRHTVIHEWLTQNPNVELDALNKKVYAELFLTPDSDKWLGLLPNEAYTALQNDGVVNAN